MSYFVRKISRGKWPDDRNRVKDIRADAITSDLRTFEDKISVWRIDDRQHLEDAILALATGPKVERIEFISVVLLPEDALCSFYDPEPWPGDTAAEHLVSTHFNIIELTYRSIAPMAKMILSALDQEIRYERYNVRRVKDILKSAKDRDLINYDKLLPNYQEVIRAL